MGEGLEHSRRHGPAGEGKSASAHAQKRGHGPLSAEVRAGASQTGRLGARTGVAAADRGFRLPCGTESAGQGPGYYLQAGPALSPKARQLLSFASTTGSESPASGCHGGTGTAGLGSVFSKAEVALLDLW